MPPGQKIFEHVINGGRGSVSGASQGSRVDKVALFEVDGTLSKLYCQVATSC